jgi:hypothetical protein
MYSNSNYCNAWVLQDLAMATCPCRSKWCTSNEKCVLPARLPLVNLSHYGHYRVLAPPLALAHAGLVLFHGTARSHDVFA